MVGLKEMFIDLLFYYLECSSKAKVTKLKLSYSRQSGVYIVVINH